MLTAASLSDAASCTELYWEDNTAMENIKRKAIVGAVGIAIASGVIKLLMTTLAIFQNTFCELHGYSPTQFSVALSIVSAGGIIAGMFIGKLVSSVGIKKLTMAASFAPIIAMAGLRYCDSILAAYAVVLVCGVLVGLATPAVMNMYIGSWFNKGKGTMVSVAQTISSVWQILFVPAATAFMVKAGPERSPLIVGCMMSVIALTGSMLMKEMPAKYGVQPVDLVEKKKKTGKAAAEEVYNVQMPANKLVTRLPAFGALVMIFLSIIAMVMLATYGVYIYNSYVGDMVVSSYYVSIATAVSMATALLFGILCDKIGVRKSIVLYGTLFVVSRFLGPIIGGKAGALIIAIFNGMQTFTTMYIGIGYPLIVGYKNMASFAGWAGALMSCGGVVGPILAMALVGAADGSYDLVVYVSGILILAATILCVVCISPKSRAVIRTADEQWIAENAHA